MKLSKNAPTKAETVIHQSQGDELYSVESEISNSLTNPTPPPETRSIENKILRTASELSLFTVVTAIGWIEPVSGTCISVCFLLLSIVKIWKDENK